MASINKIRVDGVNYDINSQDSYSTTEQAIGIWIDGKPIYRKVIQLGIMPNNETLSIAHGIQNIDIITKLYGVMNSNDTKLPLPSVTASIDERDQLTMNATNIYYGSNANRSGYTGIAVVEYTKTTDQGDISL